MVKLELLDFPGEEVTLKNLEEIGVYYSYIPVNGTEFDVIDSVCKERNYKNRDEVFISKDPSIDPSTFTFRTGKQIVLTPDNPALEEKLKIFFEEHLHDDEEIRFILNGYGRFDVRDNKDRWIGITVEKGDLIIVPSQLYHRFSLSSSDHVHALRLFQDDPKWIAIPRHK